jgi:uroporphyrinogen decarboxylase
MSWMSPKERFYTCVAHKQPDRPPIQFYTTPEFEAKLQERFPGQNLLEVLEVDFRTVGVPRKKPLRQPETGSKVAYYDEWGIGYARQSYGFGEYLEAYELPFASMTTLREVEEYPWPSVDDYDFSHLEEDCKAVGDYVVCFGHAGIPDIINGVSRGRGMEQVLIDILTEDEVGVAIIDHRVEFYYEFVKRGLEAADGLIDVLCLGEDLGNQLGPMVSPEVFDRFFRPRLQKFYDLGHQYGCKVMMHSCGSTRKLQPRFVEMGLDILDAMQPEPVGMNPEEIKREVGDKLTLRGLISTQKTLPFGTIEECIAEAKHRVEVIGKDGGYIFAPSHCIQPNTPVDNVLAAYEVVTGKRLR